jgi:eukaryotic-like serine/threonine-protein kinase
MMVLAAKTKSYPFAILIVLLALLTSHQPLNAQTPSEASDQPILYRGDQHRDGFVSSGGVPMFREIAWQKNIGEAGISSPLYADNTIYIGTNRGEMLALDAKTGDELWAFKSVGGNAGSPAVKGNIVYSGLGLDEAGGMGLYALNRQTGELLWSFSTKSPIWLTSPLIVGDKIYFGDLDGTFYAVDIKTHQKVWSIDVKRSVYWNAAADEGIVYFTALGSMYAVDANTGKQLWQISTSRDWSPLAVDNGMVYAGDLNHKFYALDGKTGKEIWTFKDMPTDRANWSAPAVADGVVYAGNRTGYMYAFDSKTGEQLWKFKADAPPTSDPLLANGILYFGVGSHGNESAGEAKGSFYAVDISSGKALWTFTAKGEIFNGPAISESSIYFLTARGILYSLQ